MKLPKTDPQAVQQSFILWHKHNKKKSKGGGTEMNINQPRVTATYFLGRKLKI